MEIPIHERHVVIEKAWGIMKEKEVDPLTAITIAEQEIENQKKKDKLGEKNYD